MMQTMTTPQQKEVPSVTFDNLYAEQAALGAMLIDHDAIRTARETIYPTHFRRSIHQKIYLALARQHKAFEDGRNPERVDLITTATMLQRTGQLDEVGDASYLKALIESCPSSANIHAYARAVVEAAQYRALLQASETLKNATNDVEGVRNCYASVKAVQKPMYLPHYIAMALRQFAAEVDLMAQAKPAPDLLKILQTITEKTEE